MLLFIAEQERRQLRANAQRISYFLRSGVKLIPQFTSKLTHSERLHHLLERIHCTTGCVVDASGKVRLDFILRHNFQSSLQLSPS